MTLVLDAGGLIAAERGDRELFKLLTAARRRGEVPRTHGGVVGQVWRGGARQARLARVLRAVEVVPLDEELGRSAGALLSRAGLGDVIDAAVVVLARDGDEIVTSDTGDLLQLAVVSATHVELVPV